MVDWAALYPRVQAGGPALVSSSRTQAEGAATVTLVCGRGKERGTQSWSGSSQSFCWVVPLVTSQFSLVKASHSLYLIQGDRVVLERRPEDAW